MVFASLFKQRDAYRVYLALEGASSLFFALIVTVNMVYQVTVVRLDPLQLVLVGTLLEAVVFIFEVPTGIVADVYSRRLSVIIGLLLIGVGFALEGAIPRFEAVLAAQVLWGLGATFTSGATQAWIADEIGERRAGEAFVRGAQVGQAGGLLGIGASVALASVHIQLPIVLGGLLFVVLGVTLAAVMPERGFTPVPSAERESWRSLWRALGDGLRLVRGRAVLLIFIGVAAFQGLSSEGFDRLWTAHMIETITLPRAGGLDPVVWFGLFGAASMLLTIGASEIVRRRVDLNRPAAVLRVLLAAYALIVLAMLGFALATGFALAVLMYLATRTLNGVANLLFNAWVNPSITSEVRATVFSFAAQINAIGQIVGGPGVGLVGRDVSLRAALVTSALLLSPVLALFGTALRRVRRAVFVAAAAD